MRLPALLVLLVVLLGCTKTQLIDRATLGQRYQETQFAEGVLSVMPLRQDAAATPPTIVNWWYAGTSDNQHRIVYRELTWDSAGQPVGNEARYRIPQNQLAVTQRFPATSDDRRWLPLYEAAANEIEPPADLPTARKAPKPFERIQLKPRESPLPPSD